MKVVLMALTLLMVSQVLAEEIGIEVEILNSPPQITQSGMYQLYVDPTDKVQEESIVQCGDETIPLHVLVEVDDNNGIGDLTDNGGVILIALQVWNQSMQMVDGFFGYRDMGLLTNSLPALYHDMFDMGSNSEPISALLLHIQAYDGQDTVRLNMTTNYTQDDCERTFHDDVTFEAFSLKTLSSSDGLFELFTTTDEHTIGDISLSVSEEAIFNPPLYTRPVSDYIQIRSTPKLESATTIRQLKYSYKKTKNMQKITMLQYKNGRWVELNNVTNKIVL